MDFIQILIKNKPKIAPFQKFKFLFALKQNFNGGQFYKEISKLGYFKKLGKVRVKLLWLRKLIVEMNSRICKKLAAKIKKSGAGWMDGWMDGRASLRIAHSH